MLGATGGRCPTQVSPWLSLYLLRHIRLPCDTLSPPGPLALVGTNLDCIHPSHPVPPPPGSHPWFTSSLNHPPVHPHPSPPPIQPSSHTQPPTQLATHTTERQTAEHSTELLATILSCRLVALPCEGTKDPAASLGAKAGVCLGTLGPRRSISL